MTNPRVIPPVDDFRKLPPQRKDEAAQDFVQELLDELITLRDARHAAHFHITDEAKADNVGHLRWCPGCRKNLIARRISEIVQAEDDVRVPDHKQVSRRDEVVEQYLKRHEVEAIP